LWLYCARDFVVPASAFSNTAKASTTEQEAAAVAQSLGVEKSPAAIKSQRNPAQSAS
jgi:hypothetical protein